MRQSITQVIVKSGREVRGDAELLVAEKFLLELMPIARHEHCLLNFDITSSR